jgi:class 3 adenylate cyclase
MRLLGIGTIVAIVIFLLPLAVPHIKNALSFKYIRVALDIEKSVSLFVQDIIPTKIAGKDMTRWIVIMAAFLLGGSFSNIKGHYRNKVARLKFRGDYESLKAHMHLSDDAKVLIPLKEKLEGTPTKKDREELLKLFAETKKKLDAMGRDLAFLAIDVVDSTGMKEGEEKAAVEHDFIEYKHLVGGKLNANGALKSAWTPDGVMSCFPTVDTAVRAAREVIIGLEAFNKNVKTIKKDFRVRCGINVGYVYFDESIPMEEMSDRVIDIAGHMQKHAPPNKICIAKPAIEPMQERAGFVPAGRVVDGYEVYVWEKE